MCVHSKTGSRTFDSHSPTINRCFCFAAFTSLRQPTQFLSSVFSTLSNIVLSLFWTYTDPLKHMYDQLFLFFKFVPCEKNPAFLSKVQLFINHTHTGDEINTSSKSDLLMVPDKVRKSSKRSGEEHKCLHHILIL